MTIKTKGAILTILAGIAWGISGVSGQYLMEHGVAVNLLTSLRMLIAGVLLTTLTYLVDRKNLLSLLKNPRALLGVFAFAIFGLMSNQLAYLQAINHTNAGTATVLQYMSPILVLAYTCLKDRLAPTLLEVGAMVLAIAGTVLLATHGNLGSLSMSPTGLFWGLFSALTYTLYILLPVKLIQTWGSSAVIGLGMLMGGLVFTGFSRSWQYPFEVSPMNLLALFGITVIGTAFAYSVFLKGVTMVGPVNASLLAAIEPVAAVFFAVTLMQEIFYAIDLLGIALIILAVLAISLKDYLLAKSKSS